MKLQNKLGNWITMQNLSLEAKRAKIVFGNFKVTEYIFGNFVDAEFCCLCSIYGSLHSFSPIRKYSDWWSWKENQKYATGYILCTQTIVALYLGDE